jgi:hypothetical protein
MSFTVKAFDASFSSKLSFATIDGAMAEAARLSVLFSTHLLVLDRGIVRGCHDAHDGWLWASDCSRCKGQGARPLAVAPTTLRQCLRCGGRGWMMPIK